MGTAKSALPILEPSADSRTEKTLCVCTQNGMADLTLPGVVGHDRDLRAGLDEGLELIEFVEIAWMDGGSSDQSLVRSGQLDRITHAGGRRPDTPQRTAGNTTRIQRLPRRDAPAFVALPTRPEEIRP